MWAACACPKGLRHGYGIRNQQSNIEQHYTQKYIEHSSMNTTAIYTTLIGDGEYEMMARVWLRNKNDNH